MTKQEQLNQEDRAIVKDMDNRAGKRANETNVMTQLVTVSSEKELIRQENKMLVAALREIAVDYPETNTPEHDKALCQYLILTAQKAIKQL